MKNNNPLNKIAASGFVTILLLYFSVKNFNIIFVPFLICSVSMLIAGVASHFQKDKLAFVFNKIFIVGFLLFWFGFLLFATFLCIRDKNYSMLLFTIPFWLAGIYVTKNSLLGIKSKSQKSVFDNFNFSLVISSILIGVSLLAGIFILILGIKRSIGMLIFMGIFFIIVASSFIIAFLVAEELFAKIKIDVLRLYGAIALVVIGVGIIVVKFLETNSFSSFGVWIIIPILMAAVGLLAVVKCIKDKDKIDEENDNFEE